MTFTRHPAFLSSIATGVRMSLIIRIVIVPAVLGLLAKIAISLRTTESVRHWAAGVRNP